MRRKKDEIELCKVCMNMIPQSRQVVGLSWAVCQCNVKQPLPVGQNNVQKPADKSNPFAEFFAKK